MSGSGLIVTLGDMRARRLAVPHRAYTQSHIDYVVEAILKVFERREVIAGYRIASQPEFLRHFTARFEPIVTTGDEQVTGPMIGQDRPSLALMSASFT